MQARHNGSEGKFAFNLYTTLLGEFERVDKNISDEAALKVIKKMIKDAEETIQYQIKHSSDCSAASEEVKLLTPFVPAGVSETAMRKLAEFGMDNNQPIGAYMGAVKKFAKDHGLDADMKLAQQVWMQEINKQGD